MRHLLTQSCAMRVGSTPCSHHSYTHHGYYVVQQPFCASMPANGGVHTSCSVYSATATGKDLSCTYSHHSSMQVPPPPNGARGGSEGEGYVVARGSSGYGDASSGSVMLVCRQDQAGRYSPTSSRSERSLYQQQQPAGGHWNPDWQAGALAMTKVPHPVRYDKYGPPSRLWCYISLVFILAIVLTAVVLLMVILELDVRQRTAPHQ